MTTAEQSRPIATVPANSADQGSSAPGVPSRGKAQRIAALDFTKGALVLIMVLYHWLNYFYGSQYDIYKYLRFLTPSFIFITGFLISGVYLAKYGVSSPQLPRRLAWRGLKILGVFAVLNVVRALVLPHAAREQLIAQHSSLPELINIYVIGTNLGGGQSKTIAFYVLVPIGYLLILSALLVIGARYYRYFFQAAFVVALSGVALLGWYGTSSAILQLLTIGLLGVTLGFVPLEKINRFTKYPYLVILAYFGYLAALVAWNVIYPVQVVGVCLSLMLIYLIGDRGGEPGAVRNIVILLGNYSLLGYIAQIAVLQVLNQGLKHTNLGLISTMATSFIAAIILTTLAVVVTDRARRRSGLIDRAYKAVFA